MNGSLRAIDSAEMLRLWNWAEPERQSMVDFGSRSDPLFVGTFGNAVICFVGFIPASTLSDVAYLWMWASPAAAAHPIMVGRFGRRLIEAALGRYPRLCGHCIDSRRWLESLGASVNADNFFTIG